MFERFFFQIHSKPNPTPTPPTPTPTPTPNPTPVQLGFLEVDGLKIPIGNGFKIFKGILRRI